MWLLVLLSLNGSHIYHQLWLQVNKSAKPVMFSSVCLSNFSLEKNQFCWVKRKTNSPFHECKKLFFSQLFCLIVSISLVSSVGKKDYSSFGDYRLVGDSCFQFSPVTAIFILSSKYLVGKCLEQGDSCFKVFYFVC